MSKGKQYRGQRFHAVKTPESIAKANELQEQHNSPDAIKLEAYFAILGIKDPVTQAAMRARTTLRRATREAWDNIFKTF